MQRTRMATESPTIRRQMIGTSLNDRFRLEEKIGSGGMSTVYRAFDPTLERWVAIKLMHRDISGGPGPARALPARGPPWRGCPTPTWSP